VRGSASITSASGTRLTNEEAVMVGPMAHATLKPGQEATLDPLSGRLERVFLQLLIHHLTRQSHIDTGRREGFVS
jgi:hypothetical protein